MTNSASWVQQTVSGIQRNNMRRQAAVGSGVSYRHENIVRNHSENMNRRLQTVLRLIRFSLSSMMSAIILTHSASDAKEVWV
eukprot:scaffold7069_cov59-Cylindrotheca_fusiformis.AAC.1